MNIFGYVRSIWTTIPMIFKKLNDIIAEQKASKDRQIESQALLEKIWLAVKPSLATKVVFAVEVEGELHEGVTNVTIKDTQQFGASVSFLDAKGFPASVQAGTVVFEGPDCVEIVEDPNFPGDETKRLVKGVKPGSGQITAKADADETDGELIIVGTLDIEVLPGTASVVTLSTGPVSDQ